MDFLPWLHFAHVLAAIVWIGGGVMLMLIGVRARSGADPHAVTQFARIVPWVGIRALTPAVAVLLATGVWMVLANAAWSFSAFWVQLALGLFALAFLVGVVYMSRVGIQLDRVESSGDEQASQLIDRWLIGYGVILLVLVVAVWDMVFKPAI